ncbi:ECF transporter S component [Microbacterium album]|uniref:ECF transporter S component n=1 Tax=Microbacterium album TaxID=2053191 RepID=A0A917IEB6_9MICO|nr:ECF transporter S component [Microbacterium album]GGH37740.1 hypothetical protein GCM10010921_07880 [Microbacterium album]
MTSVPEQASLTPSPLDAVALDLQLLRVEAGAVSYAELAARIAARREAEGTSPGAARVARSTVFDAFQTGRQRINAELVREIVLALGVSPEEAEQWRQRCLDARRAPIVSAAPGAGPVAEPARPAPGDRETEPSGPSTADSASPSAFGPSERMLRTALIVSVIVGCVGLNLFGGTVIVRLQLPLFLDMVGTATAAFALGPWWGSVVGLATNLFGAITSTPETVVFALVNVAGAVVWGYGIRRFARTIASFLVLTVAVALACSIVAVPLNVVLYGGAYPGHATEALLAALNVHGSPVLAAFVANAAISFLDKVTAGFAALALARLLTPLRLRGEVPEEIPALLRPRDPA